MRTARHLLSAADTLSQACNCFVSQLFHGWVGTAPICEEGLRVLHTDPISLESFGELEYSFSRIKVSASPCGVAFATARGFAGENVRNGRSGDSQVSPRTGG